MAAPHARHTAERERQALNGWLALVLVALWFIALIGCATTFSVLHAQDEEHHEAAALEHGGEEAEQEEEEALEAQ